MLTLPKGIIHVLRQFEAVLSERVWEWAKVLLIGAILTPGERTVAAILRVMGCADDKQFQNASLACSIALHGRVENSAACCWGCWCACLFQETSHWFWASMKRSSADEAARLPPEVSIGIRCARARSLL